MHAIPKLSIQWRPATRVIKHSLSKGWVKLYNLHSSSVLLHSAAAAAASNSIHPNVLARLLSTPRFAMAAAALRAQLNAHIASMYAEVIHSPTHPLPSSRVVEGFGLAS